MTPSDSARGPDSARSAEAETGAVRLRYHEDLGTLRWLIFFVRPEPKWWAIEELPSSEWIHVFAYFSTGQLQDECELLTIAANRRAKLGLFQRAKLLSPAADALNEHLTQHGHRPFPEGSALL